MIIVSDEAAKNSVYEYTDICGREQTLFKRPFVFPWQKIHEVAVHSNNRSDLLVSSQQRRADQMKLRTPGNVYERVNWKRFSKTLDPLLGSSIFAGLLLFLYACATQRKYVWKNDLGLSVSSTRDSKTIGAVMIPWECITDVNVIGAESKSPRVKFRLDHALVDDVKWHDIVNTIEPGEFINALRTFAPSTVQGCKFPTETALNKVDDHTYTKLWFKYYSKGTQRERAGQLTTGDELQDGRFRVLERLGGGGQGTAYLVEERRLPAGITSGLSPAATMNEVVLKEYILPVHRGQQVMEQSAQRLRQEAEILRKIDHPNIVKLIDKFTEDHRGYLVMEYVQGIHLKALVAQEGPQPEATVRDLALQICDILAYLHSMNPPIIHRDLTPDNLILQSDGTVKLVDFNVAHQLESQATATVVGKHAYIPPEQFRGKPTVQSDIYALGCTLHFLLTGQEPEPLTVSRPRLLNDRVSESLNQIVATCTAMDAGKRFARIDDVKEALLGCDKPVDIKLSEKVEA